MLVQIEVAGGLDGRERVTDARDPEERQPIEYLVGNASTLQDRAARRLVEQAEQPDRRLVVDRGHDVRVAYVVDPGDVLVADPLDPVCAEARQQQRRALECFGGRDATPREPTLQVVACSERPCGTGGPHPAGTSVAGAGDPLERRLGRRSRDAVVPQVVPEFVELVEDHRVRPAAADLPAGVEDLLDVALAAGRSNDLGADVLEPAEALAAHLLGEDRHRLAAQQGTIERPSAAVVARRGPHRSVCRRVELARHQPRHQAAERGPNLVGSGREVLAHESDDAGGNARQLRRKLERVHGSEAAGLRIVVPGDPKEVERIDGLHLHARQALDDGRIQPGGVPHLRKSGDHDLALPAPFYGSSAHALVGYALQMLPSWPR